MPPRARARGGGSKKSSTAKKSTAPARQKAKDPIKKATTTNKDEPMCPICFDDFKTMRTITLKPCGHTFHRSCCLQYFETKDKVREQTCPCCRARPTTIESENDTIEYVQAMGRHGQPSKYYLHRIRRDYNLKCGCTVLQMLRRWNWYDEGIVRAHRAAAGKKKKGEYLADIDREAAKLKKRGTIIMQMMDIMEVDHAALKVCDNASYTEWDYKLELRKAKQLMAERREAVREAAKHPVGLADANRPCAPPARAAETNAADDSSDDDHGVARVPVIRPLARMSGGGPYVISGATLRAGADMDISSSDESSEESSSDSDSSDSDDDASPGQAAMRAGRMSTGGMVPRMQLASRLLAPAASRARQTARMSTGGRAPRPVAARRVILDDDVNENSDDIEVLSVSVLGPSAAPQPEATAAPPPPAEQPKQDVTPPANATSHDVSASSPTSHTQEQASSSSSSTTIGAFFGWMMGSSRQ